MGAHWSVHGRKPIRKPIARELILGMERGPLMSEMQPPTWRSISMLPVAATLVAVMLDGAAEQERLLSAPYPYNLDKATRERVERSLW